MSAIDDAVQANAAQTPRPDAPQEGRPQRRLAVLACMDARLDLLDGLGLAIGDAHVIRNAGGLPTDDVLRSLAISQRLLDTREVLVIHHTKCGMTDFDDAGFRAQLADETGSVPGWDVPGFSDVEQEVRRSVQTVRDCPWLPHRDQVRGFVYDVTTAALSEIR